MRVRARALGACRPELALRAQSFNIFDADRSGTIDADVSGTYAPLYEHTQQTRRRLCPAPYAPSLQSLCRAGLRLTYGGLLLLGAGIPEAHDRGRR